MNSSMLVAAKQGNAQLVLELLKVSNDRHNCSPSTSFLRLY